MRRIVIEFPGPGEFGLCDVIDEYGRRCDGLAFDEMLGQVVSMTHRRLGEPNYRMQTPEEWEAERRARWSASEAAAQSNEKESA